MRCLLFVEVFFFDAIFSLDSLLDTAPDAAADARGAASDILESLADLSPLFEVLLGPLTGKDVFDASSYSPKSLADLLATLFDGVTATFDGLWNRLLSDGATGQAERRSEKQSISFHTSIVAGTQAARLLGVRVTGGRCSDILPRCGVAG